MRLFVALALPDLVKDALGQLQDGLDDAHWRDADGLHLTLTFLGEQDRHGVNASIEALSEIEGPAFDLTLSGVSIFGGLEPTHVYAGVVASEPLVILQKKIAHHLRQEGFEIDGRKFTPHVTLGSVRSVPVDPVNRYAAGHGLFRIGPFPVGAFHLFESRRGKDSATYDIVASFALSCCSEEKPAPVRFGNGM